MMEDMDSLDNKLFNNAFKRNPPPEDRKRITFADENDPLTDLLADKDDYQSGQKNTLAVREKQNDNLFDIKISSDSLSNSKTAIDKLKTSDDKSKKLSLMQDLFGDTLRMSPLKESNINKKSGQSEQEAQYTIEVPKIQTQHSMYAPTAFEAREPRRGKRTSEIINDPLGLLSLSAGSTQVQQPIVERHTASGDLNRQKSETKEYIPEWLENKMLSEDKNTGYMQERVTPTEELFDKRNRGSNKNIQQINVQEENISKISESLPHEKEGTRKLLEDGKAEINEQEKQKISIENYPQSNTVAVSNYDASKNLVGMHNSLIQKEAGYENIIQKLELEKSHLTVMIRSLNEKYENEIMILDESYKRQIGFLQERTDTLEKRMQQELECLETDYEAKIEKLKNEKMQIETFYKEEIQNLKKEHAQFIEEIYERHSQNIRLLQKEHFDTIENILKMREVENLAMTTIATHKTDLQNLLQKSDFIIENIKNVQEKTCQRDDQSVKLREFYLKNQEEDIQIRNIETKKQQELLEKERDKMMKIADRLDSHVTQLVLQLEKKSTLLNEALETLKKREQSLSHEREVFEEKVQWERNNLQVLKESWFNEQENQLRALTKEKEVIAAKRRQYEVLRTIKTSTDDITKAELATTIKAAQDATVLANQERSKWQEKAKDLEKQQQNLQEKEYRLLVRAQDLENFTQMAFVKNEQALKALKEARHIENEHRAKFDAHFNVLEQRQHTTAEKLNLASERLALRTQVEKLERSTNVNIPYNYTDERRLSNQHALQVTTHFTEIVDPQLVMLKLNLDDQLDNVQYTTAMKL